MAMGMFDGALGDLAGSLLKGQAGGGDAQNVLGGLLQQFGGQGSANGLLAAAMTLVQQQGGLEGLVQKFQGAGLGDLVQSWVGSGANAAISGDQLESVLGHDVVASVASQAGVAPSQAAGGLASVLPEIVNALTPNGQIPTDSGDLVKTVMGMLRG
jgi:uncharacterized protein YidB (DUF937 family)